MEDVLADSVKQSDISSDRSTEDLFIGVMAPIGAEKDSVIENLELQLQEQFGYQTKILKLSKYIKEKYPSVFNNQQTESSCKFCEIRNKIIFGTQYRKSTNDPSILVKNAIAEIRSLPNKDSNFGRRRDEKRRVFIFDQLKRREEIEFLSNLYGKAFFIISIYCPSEQRMKRISRQINRSNSFALELMELDQSEKDYFSSMSECSSCRGNKNHSPLSEDLERDFGQELREIFSQADLFVSDKEFEKNISRFLDLIFGSPKEFPTSEEHAMYLAFVAATRSADLSRQVGAALLNESGEIIGVGSNDVPKAGGGIYDRNAFLSEGSFGHDSNGKRISEIAENVADTLIKEKLISETTDKISITNAILKKSEVKSLTEFHRAVHGEMQAILSATRAGISPRNGTLYVTTFPCHNCAKHIISAGIRTVIFVEPYPKSLAERLHQDAISVVEDGSMILDKVNVRPFLGIGPRRFLDLFSMNLSSGTVLIRKKGFEFKRYIRKSSQMRFALAFSPDNLEILAEEKFLLQFKNQLEQLIKQRKDSDGNRGDSLNEIINIFQQLVS